jgi:hypothetical protein
MIVIKCAYCGTEIEYIKNATPDMKACGACYDILTSNWPNEAKKTAIASRINTVQLFETRRQNDKLYNKAFLREFTEMILITLLVLGGIALIIWLIYIAYHNFYYG